MPYWKLQLPETLKAGAFETWVPKLELGNQRSSMKNSPRIREEIKLRVLRAFVVIAFK